MARNGKIAIENLAGGELTSAPLLSTPPQYSRRLQNFYINSEGHIKKIPGWSAVSNQVSGVQIRTGIDFKKQNGTSIKLVGGRAGSNGALYRLNSGVLTSVKDDFTSLNPLYLSQIGDLVVASNGVDLPISYDGTTVGNLSMPFDAGAVVFEGTGLNDMSANVTESGTTSYEVEIDGVAIPAPTVTFSGAGGKDDMTAPSPNYSGAAATANFDVEIDGVGAGPDTAKYNVNGGAFVAGNELSTGGAQDYVSYRTTGIYSNVTPPFPSLGAWQSPQALVTVDPGVNLGIISVKSVSTSGHAETDYYTVSASRVDGIGALISYSKNGGAATNIPLDSGVWHSIDGDFSFMLNAPLANLTAFNTLFRSNNQATDLTVAWLKSNSVTGHLNTDVYEFQILGNYGDPGYETGLGYQWRKNGGAWTPKTILYANATMYDTIADGYSILFKSPAGNTVNDIYSFQVDGATASDTFKWRKDAEAYTEGVAIAAGDMTLKEGVKVNFKYFTGHAIPNTWTFDVARDTVQYRDVLGAWTTGQIITGAFQSIVAGVQFKFESINGHTLNDKWTIPVNQSVRFGKSFPYKNRLWLVADNLTAYYSELSLPTIFTTAGSGYIDFRYVIPEGDELLDISSTLNYLAFFFRNHVVVYSGSDPTATGDFAIYQNLAGVGVVATGCVVQVGSDIMFLTPRGVKGLSQVINSGALNVNNVSAAIDTDIIDAINANSSGVYGSAHYQKLGLVMFLIGTSIFVFNYRQNAWSRIVIPSTNDVSKVLSMFTAQDGALYMGGYDYLFQFDPAVETFNFNGQAPAYRWTGPMWKTTTAEAMFFNELLMRLASTAAVNLTIKVRTVGFDTGVEDQSAFNEQVIQVPAITTNDAVLNFARIPLFGAGRYVQVDITESPNYDSNSDVEICSVEAHGELGII